MSSKAMRFSLNQRSRPERVTVRSTATGFPSSAAFRTPLGGVTEEELAQEVCTSLARIKLSAKRRNHNSVKRFFLVSYFSLYKRCISSYWAE